ncbi:MAG TPA: class I poly(R)-hydroxyalkanoic acid synthase [Acetobacteraceae bacterium]
MPDLPNMPPSGARPGYPPALDRSIADVAARSQRLVRDWLARQSHEAQPINAALVASAFLDMTAQLMRDPTRVVRAGIGFWQDYMTLWQSSARRMWGMDAPPVISAVSGDRRFDGEAWNSSEVFGFIKQSYLLSARYIQDVTSGAAGLDLHAAQRVDYYARHFISAMSPANFLLTNPEALRRTAETGGENLLRGLSNLLSDLERGRGRLLAGAGPSRLGRDLAATPGKVVFQNRLMQLIQYAPATEQVLRRPLLIVPPWTGKFYVLDLQPRSSLIRWAVSQGHTVFCISWVNPDESIADAGFEDYMRDGILAALDAIGDATGEQEVNAAGYSIGGTLLAAAAAGMAAMGDARIRSLSLFATMLDFTEAGGLGVFMDEEGLRCLEERPEGRGGMTTPTGMLRANDLIWSFVVNTYLLGAEPFPFDLLHWNADATRLPAALHGFYLRRIYQGNLLRVPGGLTLLGQPVDLGRITVPSYALATREDHIAPWASAYRGAALLGGERRFVLAGSGHVAGVVNPPEGGRYTHWIGGALPEAPEEWLAGATEMAGSWWPDWHRWMLARDAATVPARVPGTGGLPALADAPGSYVMVRTE